MQKNAFDFEQDVEVNTQPLFGDEVPCSSSSDALMLFDGGSLSPETLSAIQGTSRINMPQFAIDTQRTHPEPNFLAEPRGILRLKPSSSVAVAQPGLSQWEPRASPPANVFGLALSDLEQNDEKTLEMGSETQVQTRIAPVEDEVITFKFEPNPLERHTSLFYDTISSAEDDE